MPLKSIRSVSSGVALVALVTGASALTPRPASAEASDAYAYCLSVGSGEECAFQTLAQCEASRSSGTSTCERNPSYGPTTRRYQRDQ